MNLISISGAVSHCRVVSNTHGHVDARHGGNIRTTHETMFRVAGKPVQMNGTISVDNGDTVTVVGLQASDGLHAIALRDHDSGLTITAPEDKRFLAAGIILLFTGVSCAPLLMGAGAAFVMVLIPLGGAWFCFSKFFKRRELTRAAHAMLDSGAAVQLTA